MGAKPVQGSERPHAGSPPEAGKGPRAETQAMGREKPGAPLNGAKVFPRYLRNRRCQTRGPRAGPGRKKIKMVETTIQGIEIDTPEDLAKAQMLWLHNNKSPQT